MKSLQISTLLVWLSQLTAASQWKYTLNLTNGVSYHTDFNKYNIAKLDHLAEKCQNKDKSVLFEMPDSDTNDALAELMSWFAPTPVAMNLKRIDYSKWFWSNTLPNFSTFDQREIESASSGKIAWYGYLQCSGKNFKCIYKSEHLFKQTRGFICQYQRDCRPEELNAFTTHRPGKNLLCYKIFTEQKTWSVARDECLRGMGDLAVFEGLGLGEVEALVKEGGSWWVGLQKAKWMWLYSEQEARFTKWQGGDPDPVYDALTVYSNVCAVTLANAWKAVSCMGFYGLVCMHTEKSTAGLITKEPTKIDPILPILFAVSLILIFVAIIAILCFIRNHKKKGARPSRQLPNIPKPVEPRGLPDENKATYLATVPDESDPKYFKVFDITASDASAIRRQNMAVPRRHVFHKAFEPEKRKPPKSEIFDENIVFSSATSGLDNKGNKNRSNDGVGSKNQIKNKYDDNKNQNNNINKNNCDNGDKDTPKVINNLSNFLDDENYLVPSDSNTNTPTIYEDIDESAFNIERSAEGEDEEATYYNVVDNTDNIDNAVEPVSKHIKPNNTINNSQNTSNTNNSKNNNSDSNNDNNDNNNNNDRNDQQDDANVFYLCTSLADMNANKAS